MSRKFNKTKFPGIYLLNTTNGDIVYYAFYRQEGKQVCDKLGKRSEGWNLLQARDARIQRIAGCQETTVSRKRRQALENDEENSIPPLSELMGLYFAQRTAERGKPLKTEIEFRQRFQKHFSIHWCKACNSGKMKHHPIPANDQLTPHPSPKLMISHSELRSGYRLCLDMIM